MADPNQGEPSAPRLAIAELNTTVLPINGHSAEPPPGIYVDPANEHMAIILSRYSAKVVNANRNFIVQRVEEIKAQNLTSEEDSLNMMARFWFHKHRWPRTGNDWFSTHMRPHNVSEQTRLEEAVTTIEQVKELRHPFMSGLLPRSMPSREAADISMDALEAAAREYMTEHGPQFGLGPNISLKVPTDMRIFCAHTNGLCDPDFRYELSCNWSLVDEIDTSDLDDLDAFKEHAQAIFKSNLIKLPDHLSKSITAVLDVNAGFYTGDSETWDEKGLWSGYYLFCRRRLTASMPQENDGWAWRVVFNCWDEPLDYHSLRLPVFDDVHSLLSWYSSWVDCPNLRNMIDMVYESSSDSDEGSGEVMPLEGIPNEPR